MALLFEVLVTNAQTYTDISSATGFNLILRSDSTVWGWGNNLSGQLGTGDTIMVTSPRPLDISRKWIAISGGGFHRIGLMADSTLWGCGLNANYQLGISAITSVDTMMQLSAKHWRLIKAGSFNSAAIRNDGTLWMAGYNVYGMLGSGDTVTRTGFVCPDSNVKDWKTISVGGSHVLAIKNNGSLWAWGDNSKGEVGLGDTKDLYLKPTQIGKDTDWEQVSAGFFYSLALKKDGTLWSWGDNSYYELGRTTTGIMDTVITKVSNDTDWVSASTGCIFAFALKKDGTLWGWGNNVSGQLGISLSIGSVTSPQQVGSDNDWKLICAEQGLSFSAGSFVGTESNGLKDSAKSVCTAGSNQNAELGNGSLGGPDQDYFSCSTAPVERVPINDLKDNIQVFPNPALDQVNINISPGIYSDKMKIVVEDVNGHVLINRFSTGKNIITLNISALIPGLYFIRITNKENVFVSKLTKL